MQAGVTKAFVVCVCVCVCLDRMLYTALQVHQNWSYNVAGLFRICSLEGYTVETGILDGMDETYKMFALPERGLTACHVHYDLMHTKYLGY